MSGAAWNPKKKTAEQEWFELVIMKNEYPDILTTEDCLVEEENFKQKSVEENKDTTDKSVK